MHISKGYRDGSQERDYWPTRHWRISEPQKWGLDAALFGQLETHIQRTETLRSVLVLYSGDLIFEKYSSGGTQNIYQNVNSITKSVVSALVGIALQEGFLQDIDQPLLSFFPEYIPQDLDPRRKAITLRHLLSMSSGYALPPGDSEAFLSDPPLLEYGSSLEKLLGRPMEHEPGEVFAYDDLSSHIVALVLTRSTGMPLATFAQTRLFDPLGIWRDEQNNLYPWQRGTHAEDDHHPFGLWNEQEPYLWSVDKQGHHIGSYGLQLTTRELAKFGYLYLNRGQWDGQQLISADYVQASWRQQSKIENDRAYGYLWYLLPLGRHASFCAIGYGGQLLLCLPDLDTVIVVTSIPTLDASDAARKVVRDFIVPALEDAVLR
ncbi:MAG: serine hydrolase [Ktedonobacteraceae bacterium]|nr:serine hydrolase [Ktedonobacteraceae bacterium]